MPSATRLLVPAFLLVALTGCGPASPLDAALDALGGRAAVEGVSAFRLEAEETMTAGEGDAKRELTARSVYVLTPPGGMAGRTESAGLLRRWAVRGDGGWVRMGAAGLVIRQEFKNNAESSKNLRRIPGLLAQINPQAKLMARGVGGGA